MIPHCLCNKSKSLSMNYKTHVELALKSTLSLMFHHSSCFTANSLWFPKQAYLQALAHRGISARNTHFLTWMTPICPWNSNRLPPPLKKTFLAVLFHLPLLEGPIIPYSITALIVSSAFLSVLRKTIKIYTPGMEFLPPRPHSIVFGSDIWVLQRILGNSWIQAHTLYAQRKTLDFMSRAVSSA